MDRIKKPFRKHLDRQRAKLKTYDLFTVQPKIVGRIMRASPEPGFKASVGDKVLVEPDASGLVARKGMSVIGRIANPPTSIIDKLNSKSCILPARVAEVNQFSGTLGLEIDE